MLLVAIRFVVLFTGMTIKTLLSVIFEKAYDVSYKQSSLIAGAVLGVYCICNTLSPFFAARERPVRRASRSQPAHKAPSGRLPALP